MKTMAIAVEASASTRKMPMKKDSARQLRDGAPKRTAEKSSRAPSTEGPIPHDNQAGTQAHSSCMDQEDVS